MFMDLNDFINFVYYGFILNGKEIECMDVIEVFNFGFVLGNVFKYVWCFGRK